MTLIEQIRTRELQRGFERPTPAVALTAYTRDQDRAEAQAVGFSRFLVKPIAATVLVRTVAECVGRVATE